MNSFALARAYQQSFETHPYCTLALTNGAMNALGDAVAQVTQRSIDPGSDHRKRCYDIPRTMRFFAFGVGIGPLIGRWNFFLENNFPLRALGSGNTGKVNLSALARRVCADQLILAPFGLALFIGSMGLMEGRDIKHTQQRYRDMYKPALLTNWEVWPVAQLINFRYMPLPYRIPFQSTCGVFWTLYLSLLNAKESEEQSRENCIQHTVDSV